MIRDKKGFMEDCLKKDEMMHGNSESLLIYWR